VKYVRFRLQDIYERDAYTCQICRKRVLKRARYRKSDGKIHPRSPSIDHIVAMARGGNHEPHNCQTACFICNSRKGASGGGQLRLSLEPTPAM
jgi:5-methylcytosine-specific restriction endonuclease McrA